MAVGGHFVSAYNSSILFAKAQTKVPECRPARLVLMGSGAMLRGLPEYLESSLALPVELFDPIPSVDLSALPEAAASALRQDQGGIAVTLGLAQMAAEAGPLRVEILPESDRRKRRFVRHTSYSIAAAAVLAASLVVAWTMLSSAASTARGEREVLTSRQRAYAGQNEDFSKARKLVEQANAEKAALRKLVALAPAYQRITDIVHAVQNSGADPAHSMVGYDEIAVTKVSASLTMRQLPTDKDEEPRREPTPVVEFEAVGMNVGARSANQAYESFCTNLRAEVNKAGGLVIETLSTQNQNTGAFRFVIAQVKTPEEVAAAAAAPKDAEQD
jgi:hypothetical protein